MLININVLDKETKFSKETRNHVNKGNYVDKIC